MLNIIISAILSIALAVMAMFMPDSVKLQVMPYLILAVLFVPKVNLINEFMKVYEEDSTIRPTIGRSILSYLLGYKYCAQRCNQIKFVISTIIDVIAIAPLMCMFSLNFFGKNVAGYLALAVCVIIMLAGSLILVLPQFTVEDSDRILGFIWIAIVLISAIIVVILPLPIRVSVTQYYILFTLVAVYISKIIDTQNILSVIGRVSFASYLPLFGAGALVYQLKCVTYEGSKYELQ